MKQIKAEITFKCINKKLGFIISELETVGLTSEFGTIGNKKKKLRIVEDLSVIKREMLKREAEREGERSCLCVCVCV